MPTVRTPVLVAALISLCLPVAAASAEPVRPADAFVDSIGVNVHMTYGDTAYRDRSRLVDKLSDSGIRHVRDGLSWNTDYAYDTFNQLADRGIRTTFIMGDPSERRDTLDQLLTALRTKVPRAAEAVEGPNEYSYSGDPQWADHLRTYQTRLFEEVKRDPALTHLPVLAPSLISWQDHADLGDLRSALDFGNKHSYPGGDLPEGNMDQELSVAARVSGDRQVYVTESGYHNALATTGGHRPISEDAAAIYLPRMYLEYFRRGILRTFTYELIDEWPDAATANQESNFGLLRNDYSEKPAFRSLTNLISLLSDRGGDQPVQPLDLSVADAPPDLRRLVLQKRDGSYYVVLWRAVRVWDPVARQPLSPGTRAVTVHVGQGAGQAELFSPTSSTRPYATAPVSGGIPVTLGADPIVIRLPSSTPSPVASPPATPTAPAGPLTPAAPFSPPVPKVKRPRKPSASIPSGQRLRSVLRSGLIIRCRATDAGGCRATARSGRRIVAAGRLALQPAGGSIRQSVRLTREGRRVLRRALARRRPLTLKMQASFGGGRVVTRSVLLRR